MEDQEGDRTGSVIGGWDLIPWDRASEITPSAIPCTIKVYGPRRHRRS
jgi:hypothetical protein